MLAKRLNLSHWTVSAALRNSPRVKAVTKARVQKAARAAGYRHNPLASALMSTQRRSRHSLFRGVLGVIMLEEPGRPAYGNLFPNAQIRGARERAAQLGYKIEVFTVGEHYLPLRRLESILQARGITGLMLMPAWKTPDYHELNWSHYAGVYADYLIVDPPLHSICPDHFRAMTDVLTRLNRKGYRRPGLFIRRRHNERVHHRWEAALLVAQHHAPDVRPVPSLIVDEVTRSNFVAWFKRHNPDVVIGHDAEAVAWMRACGARIPTTHGFFGLNIIVTPKPMAGLDQQPYLIGSRAIDILTGQLYRNERGVFHPDVLTTIPSVFVDGPTLRKDLAPR
jgi:LacI family transcriptional regulator